MQYRIGVDVGGTNIVCGLVNERYEVVDSLRQPTEAQRESDAIIGDIADSIERLIKRNGLRRDSIASVGAGIPGTIDPDAGICIGSANLRWYDVHVAGHLEQLLDMRVRIDNDVRMYVLGESKFGAGRRYRSVFGITLGTGVCGAFAEAGQLYYGSHKLAGEIGHIPIDGETSPCGCGKIGCLETIASATGLTARARQAIAEGYNSVLTQLAPDLKSLTSEHLSLAYDRGDQLAIETMHHAGRTLGKVLSYAVICYDPEVIVVGGGVARAGDRILAAARQEMAERVLRRQRAVDIIVAQLGDDAGVIGSAFHARSLPR